MLPLLVTWGLGANVTFSTVTQPQLPVTRYSTKVRFWHGTKLKLNVFGGEFKCYNVLQSTCKNRNKWGIYLVITCYCNQVTCYRYKVGVWGVLKS